MKFWLKQRLMRKKLSYADCLGYIIALREKIEFFTGEDDFKGLHNVEFVK